MVSFLSCFTVSLEPKKEMTIERKKIPRKSSAPAATQSVLDGEPYRSMLARTHDRASRLSAAMVSLNCLSKSYGTPLLASRSRFPKRCWPKGDSDGEWRLSTATQDRFGGQRMKPPKSRKMKGQTRHSLLEGDGPNGRFGSPETRTHPVIGLIESWLAGDVEQRETWAFLKENLDRDRLSDRKLFPEKPASR